MFSLVKQSDFPIHRYSCKVRTLMKYIYNQEKKIFQPPIHSNHIQQLLDKYITARVPVPKIIRKIWEEFKNNDQFETKCKQYKQRNERPQSFFGQKQAKKLEFKKTYFKENIEAAKSLRCSLTITKILDIIEQQKDVCLGCLKSLEEGKPIPKTNQLYSLVYGKFIDGVLQDNVKKKTCAILNDRGGYLFISESIKKNSVKGLTLNQGEIYQLRQFVLKTIKNSIFPDTFEFKVDSIKVTNQKNKNAKSILRVSLRPNGGNGFYFVKKEVLNYPSVFTCYFLDLEAVGEINDICVLKQTESIYKILTKHRSLKNTEIFFDKLECIERSNAMRNLVNQIDLRSIQNLKSQKQINKSLARNQLNKFILIIHNESNDRYIPEIKKIIGMKDQFIFQNLFLQCRSKSMKSMWLITHSSNFNNLKYQLDYFSKTDNKFLYTFLTFTKYLCIEKIQNLDFKQKCLENFQKKFNKDPQFFVVKLDNSNYSVYFKFSQYLESFYIFSYLDNIGIKSKLIKETKYLDASKMLKKCSN